MLNIIAGSKKKAKLDVPIINVRPTSSKKREAIFSIVESKNLKNKSDIYSDGYFLDLFAGSGSLGLEAISRGAKYCYFYEIAKEVIETLESNCLKICEYNNYKIIKKDITKSFFEEIDNPLSVIYTIYNNTYIYYILHIIYYIYIIYIYFGKCFCVIAFVPWGRPQMR